MKVCVDMCRWDAVKVTECLLIEGQAASDEATNFSQRFIAFIAFTSSFHPFIATQAPSQNPLFQRAPNPPEFAQPGLIRVKVQSSAARGYKFGCVCSYTAGHYPGILLTGRIGTNTPKFVPPRWGRPRFDPTQTGLCKFGCGFGARSLFRNSKRERNINGKPVSQRENKSDAAFFAYSWKLPAYSGAFSYLQLPSLAFFLTIGAFSLTVLALYLQVGAFLFIVGSASNKGLKGL